MCREFSVYLYCKELFSLFTKDEDYCVQNEQKLICQIHNPGIQTMGCDLHPKTQTIFVEFDA